jgi:GNAT superfamily N-acetyltransferase
MPHVNLRAPEARDHDAWLVLWHAYLRFNRAKIGDDVTALLWSRLVDPEGVIRGLVAEREGTLIGFVHYHFHPGTFTVSTYCYLEDLFVDRDARGSGAGRALVEGVFAAADRAGAARTYWHTHEYNGEARALYDTVAERTSLVHYKRR